MGRPVESAVARSRMRVRITNGFTNMIIATNTIILMIIIIIIVIVINRCINTSYITPMITTMLLGALRAGVHDQRARDVHEVRVPVDDGLELCLHLGRRSRVRSRPAGGKRNVQSLLLLLLLVLSLSVSLLLLLGLSRLSLLLVYYYY